MIKLGNRYPQALSILCREISSRPAVLYTLLFEKANLFSLCECHMCELAIACIDLTVTGSTVHNCLISQTHVTWKVVWWQLIYPESALPSEASRKLHCLERIRWLVTYSPLARSWSIMQHHTLLPQHLWGRGGRKKEVKHTEREQWDSHGSQGHNARTSRLSCTLF